MSASFRTDGARDETVNPKCDRRTKNMAPPLATSTNRNRDRERAPAAGIGGWGVSKTVARTRRTVCVGLRATPPERVAAEGLKVALRKTKSLPLVNLVSVRSPDGRRL